MDDRDFYERLNRAASALAQEGGAPLTREDVERLSTTLRELAAQPSTAGDRERLAALHAVRSQLHRFALTATSGGVPVDPRAPGDWHSDSGLPDV